MAGFNIKHWFADGAFRTIIRNSAWLGSSNVVSALLGLLALSCAGKGMTPAMFGVLVIVQSYAKSISDFIKFQIWQLVVQYGTPALTNNNPQQFRNVVSFSFSLDIVSGAVAIVGGIALLPFLSHSLGLDDQSFWLAALYCTLIPSMASSTPTGILRAVDRFDLIAVQQATKPFLRAAGSVVAWLNKAPQFSIEQISPSVAILDSDDGMGHSALISATEHAIKLALEEGLGFVSVKNTSHCGALSYFAEMVTNKGLVAIVMTQTDTCVAPHGGAERFLGTNPIAFGFPVENSHPMIVDMATSATAFGKILHAKETGKHIGEGLAIDKDGYGTTDPHKIENLLPFGQHKGSGIALAIDALTGMLMNANFGNHIVRMYGDYDKMRKLASLVIAIDPKKLGNPVFAKTMAQMVTELHAVKPAPGIEKVLAPNDPQMHYKEKCQQEGIPVPAGIFHYLAEN